MTDREKAIVMAYTGVCMLTGNKFGIFHEYVEDIMGRAVQTIEMGMESVADEIKEKARPDFLKLCEEDQEPCSDCISRESIIGIVNHQRFGMSKLAFSIITEKVKELPFVTPMPKVGRWITDRCNMYICSNCSHTYTDLSGERYGMNFCPNCGRKMSEVEKI